MDLSGNNKNKITGKKYQPVMSVTGLNDQGLNYKHLLIEFLRGSFFSASLTIIRFSRDWQNTSKNALLMHCTLGILHTALSINEIFDAKDDQSFYLPLLKYLFYSIIKLYSFLFGKIKPCNSLLLLGLLLDDSYII